MQDKEVLFMKAFDKRDDDPNKDYGIHGVDIHFTLRGTKGAVSFVVFTHWHLNQAMFSKINRADGAGMSTHIPATAEDIEDPDTYTVEDCYCIGGQDCYGSTYHDTESTFQRLVEEGHDGVWEDMMQVYEKEIGDYESQE